MQNQPIIAATPSVAPANPIPPTGNAADANAAPTSETFGSVLARQRANNDSAARGGKQASTSSDDKLNDAEMLDGQQAAVADLLGMLPGDMLAALLPKSISGTDTETGEKDTRKMRPALEQDALRTQPLASDATASALAVTSMAAIPLVMHVAPQAMPSGKPTRSVATDVPNIATLPPAAGREAPSLPRAQPLVASEAATTTQTNIAMDALKPLRTEIADASPLEANVHNVNSALAPQPTISTGVNVTPQVVAALATQPGTPAQVTVNTPLGKNAWTDDFNQSITWLATRQAQSAQIHLNPPNLGPLDVVLNVSDGQATALFTSPHAAVREVVEQALPRLREMLADSGITLGNATVSDQSPRDQQASFTNNQLKGGANVSDKAIGVTDVTQSAGSTPERRHQGMVDTFA